MPDRKRDSERETPPFVEENGGENGAAEEGAPAPADLSAELEEAKNRLAYLAAEFDNYRKRAVREKEALVSYGNERILRAILPFLDNLERAMSQAGGEGAAEGLLAGVRLTYDQLLGELRKFGLEQIASEGEMFDPNLHEAILQVPASEASPGTVLTETRKGYLLHGRLLRPAQVTVAMGPAGEAD